MVQMNIRLDPETRVLIDLDAHLKGLKLAPWMRRAIARELKPNLNALRSRIQKMSALLDACET